MVQLRCPRQWDAVQVGGIYQKSILAVQPFTLCSPSNGAHYSPDSPVFCTMCSPEQVSLRQANSTTVMRGALEVSPSTASSAGITRFPSRASMLSWSVFRGAFSQSTIACRMLSIDLSGQVDFSNDVKEAHWEQLPAIYRSHLRHWHLAP